MPEHAERSGPGDPVMAPAISGGSVREADVPVAPAIAWTAARPGSQSPLAQALSRLRRNKTALVGAGVVAMLVLVAIFADVLAPRSPITADQTRMFQRPSLDYPLGTDQLGRDMLSRVIHGTRISLLVGVS